MGLRGEEEKPSGKEGLSGQKPGGTGNHLGPRGQNQKLGPTKYSIRT